ncbi:hypothetical protein U9M48_008968 [Paspalum notatum var. saurae]|uniref:Uncharacterized protein n=1 Tax=Paspalum notatum var. saurae TaxID=547442 RepID=A0AAQ3SQ32_PASNO
MSPSGSRRRYALGHRSNISPQAVPLGDISVRGLRQHGRSGKCGSISMSVIAGGDVIASSHLCVGLGTWLVAWCLHRSTSTGETFNCKLIKAIVGQLIMYMTKASSVFMIERKRRIRQLEKYPASDILVFPIVNAYLFSENPDERPLADDNKSYYFHCLRFIDKDKVIEI